MPNGIDALLFAAIVAVLAHPNLSWRGLIALIDRVYPDTERRRW